MEDANLARQLLGSVGLCELIPESQQNAFTGLAASGPAYIYTILEGLADGGVRCGLPRNVAVKFAAQMTLGAAKMSLDSGNQFLWHTRMNKKYGKTLIHPFPICITVLYWIYYICL